MCDTIYRSTGYGSRFIDRFLQHNKDVIDAYKAGSSAFKATLARHGLSPEKVLDISDSSETLMSLGYGTAMGMVRGSLPGLYPERWALYVNCMKLETKGRASCD